MTEPRPQRPVPGPPRPGPGPVPIPPRTDDARTDDAPADDAARTGDAAEREPRLADLAERPVAEHVEVFEAEHARLQRELGTIDQL